MTARTTPAPALRPAPAAAPLVALLLAVLVALVAALVAVAPGAQAAGYRYWSFWKWSGSAWAYQQVGPAGFVPADGAVDGWRFAVSPDGGQDAARPTATGEFTAICADTPPAAGRKRVAVVLDFGTAADAPGGEQPPAPRTACAAVPAAASSADVLAAVAPPLRYDSAGVLCAIAGYPRAGCADTVAAPAAPAAGGAPADDGPSLGLVAGGALVAALAAGAVWQARRRR
ncbi:SCO2322 family protein [Kitasatospora sp. NPDC048365]|uniref:SCO2322 family protein n=1 Tax=Kitasatospora sp. NPDC048365 TaxID=3364050 RepID=UPI00371E9A0F